MLIFLSLATALLAAEPGGDSPALRHVNYVAFQPGRTAVTARLSCRRHSWRYDDGLRYRLLVGDANVVDRGQLEPEQSRTCEWRLPPKLHAIELDSGANLVSLRLDGAPWGVVCSRGVPASMVGEARWYIFQAAEHRGFFTVSAAVHGEGCRVVVRTLDGPLLLDSTSDFDQPQQLAIPDAGTARILELRVLAPNTDELTLDDVELQLGRGLAPYLTVSPADARRMGDRWSQWSAQQPSP